MGTNYKHYSNGNEKREKANSVFTGDRPSKLNSKKIQRLRKKIKITLVQTI